MEFIFEPRIRKSNNLIAFKTFHINLPEAVKSQLCLKRSS